MSKTEIPISGNLVGWTLSNNTDRTKIEEAWIAAGYGRFVPTANSEKSALHAALKRVWGGPRCLVRPVSGSTYAVVAEKAGDDSLEHDVSFIAKVPDSDSVMIRFYDEHKSRVIPPRAAEVQAAFMAELDKLPSPRMARSLVSVLDSMHAIPFKAGRGNGGVYYLPQEHYAKWTELMDAVIAADPGGTNSHHEMAIAMNAKTCSTVLESVTATLLKETEDMATDIAGDGSNGELGKRALKSKQSRADHLRQRVKRYESLLNTNLSALSARIEDVDSAAAMATLSLLAAAK